MTAQIDEPLALADFAPAPFHLTDLYLSGQWIRTTDGLDVLDPTDGSVVGRVSVATETHALKALEAARRYAQQPMGEQQRASVLMRWADRIDQQAEHRAHLLTPENGKSINNSRVEIQRAAVTARCHADAARTLNCAAYERIAHVSSITLDERRDRDVRIHTI